MSGPVTSHGSEAPLPSPEMARRLLLEMQRIRRFEEECVPQYQAGRIRGFLHLYVGEEAIAAGVVSQLRTEDAVVGTYREHGQALVRGISAQLIMAELFGKREGCARGRGGSMHLFDAATRFYGGNAIVGGGLPLAVGLALADKLLRRPGVTACFFGEGAVAEGAFHESLNLASLWQLPVLFVCENNQYAMGTPLEIELAGGSVRAKAEVYGVESISVDGMDVAAVWQAAEQAIASVRAGKPVLLECKTYRFRAHSMFDAELYRSRDEVRQWETRDPIRTFRERLLKAGLLDQAGWEQLEKQVAAEVAAAVEFASAGTEEPAEQLERFLYAEPLTQTGSSLKRSTSPPKAEPDQAGSTAELTYREAVRESIRSALQADSRVFLMGEDVGHYGGCFAVSKGLLTEFGPERIRDTPLSELAFVGAGIGAALGGMRPIVEIMTVNFSLLALDQILNTAATLCHMSGGQFPVPLVIRMATGGGKQLAAQHSHSLEGWFAHIPGLVILTPATIDDARWMLGAALQRPDPVLIFESQTLYNLKGRIEGEQTGDIFRAMIRRPGNDVTVLTYGASLHKALAAAEQLAAEGVQLEVVDLRVLRPLDDATIRASVAKTHRVLIVDEGWRSGGISAELMARVMEQSFFDLDAPVQRICTAEVPLPYSQQLEQAALPQVEGIVKAVKEMLHGKR